MIANIHLHRPFAVLALLGLAWPGALHAQSALDTAVLVSATVQSSPPAITLAWPAHTGATRYDVKRKTVEATSWTTLESNLPGSSTGYTDTGVTVGSAYEYHVGRVATVSSIQVSGFGFLCAGIEVTEIEQRGTVVLLVDATFAAPLVTELARLERDLVGDGWKIVRHDVAPSATVPSVRALVQAAYNADPANVKALFLFGNIPQPYSGQIVPDGHGDHVGAWPTDLYYADVNGVWTDTSVNITSAADPRNRNVPGDGKFDQSTIPSDVELQTGRVSLGRLGSFPASETELLRRYLDKNHAFRRRWYEAQRRALVDDNFGYFGTEAFASDGWRNGAAFFGAAGVASKDYMTTLASEPHLFGYGCGPGDATSALGVGATTNFVNQEVHTVFTGLFGSYFGDWDSYDNFLRAPLASSPTALASFWGGRPHWFLQHMGLGLPIGYGARVTQNNNTLYALTSNYNKRSIHIGLMGDPTLRLHMVAPPTRLMTALGEGGVAELSWEPSANPVAGYHVYRSAEPLGPYVRLNATLLPTPAFTDPAPLTGTSYYSIRAVKLETSSGGTYYNPSQGTFASYPPSTITMTVRSPHGTAEPAAGTHAYAAFDAALRGSIVPTDITNGATRYLLQGWTGTGSVPAHGDGAQTPFFEMTEDSSLAWRWATNHWVTGGVVGSGTIDLASGWLPQRELRVAATPAPDMLFSYWSGTLVPPGSERVNPLTLDLAAPGDLTAHFVSNPNPGNVLPYVENFEFFGAGSLLPGIKGWRAIDAQDAWVSGDPVDAAAVAACGAAHGFPVAGLHERTAHSQRRSHVDVTAPGDRRVTVRMLTRFEPIREEDLLVAADATQQAGIALDEEVRLRVLHADPATGLRHWSAFEGLAVDTSIWHRVEFELDYATVTGGYRYFRVRLDGGAWLEHPSGYSRNDGTGAPSGPWFAFANDADRPSGLDILGQAKLDDLVVAESWGSPGADADGNGLGDVWEFARFGQTGSVSDDDPDDDGAPNANEFNADTDPTDPDSRLVFDGLSVEPSGSVRVEWRGGRDAVQVLESRAKLTEGDWQPVWTNRPPMPTTVNHTDEQAGDGGFYRLRAFRE